MFPVVRLCQTMCAGTAPLCDRNRMLAPAGRLYLKYAENIKARYRNTIRYSTDTVSTYENQNTHLCLSKGQRFSKGVHKEFTPTRFKNSFRQLGNETASMTTFLGDGDVKLESFDTPDLIFRQMFDNLGGSSTYTYILGDPGTKEALLIDPVLEMVDRDLAAVAELGLTLKLCVNTHCHADHITSSGKIKQRMPDVKSVIAAASKAKADIHVKGGDEVTAGGVKLEVRPTPGHTDGCITLVTAAGGGLAFTGDALLIGGCGRTDFQGGDAGMLYDSVHGQIFSLPDQYKIFPAHDYKRNTVSTVLKEKTENPRLTKSKPEFVELMANLNLPMPKKIDTAVPANMQCGI